MAPILQCSDVTVRFGGVTALKNLSLEVERGEIRGLIGPNGAGKTTFFNAVTGVVKPSTGKIIFDGKEITGRKPHEICKLGVSRTHQLIKPFKNMSVLENVLVGAYFGVSGRVNSNVALDDARKSIKLVGLDGYEDTKVGTLDVLSQKLVEIARALATRPKLLLLDEPVAGLSQHETRKILNIVEEVRKNGVTIILVEHVLKAVMTTSDRITVLNDGEKIFEGTPREVSVAPKVVEAYLGEEYSGGGSS
ncbi:MAG: ABC transporter ATP-binding protein [Nitrososphaerota archaeon]